MCWFGIWSPEGHRPPSQCSQHPTYRVPQGARITGLTGNSAGNTVAIRTKKQGDSQLSSSAPKNPSLFLHPFLTGNPPSVFPSFCIYWIPFLSATVQHDEMLGLETVCKEDHEVQAVSGLVTCTHEEQLQAGWWAWWTSSWEREKVSTDEAGRHGHKGLLMVR